MSKSLTIVNGSLLDVSAQQKQSLAETFIGCDCVIIVDTSGSMDEKDSRGGLSRYEVARQELASLQKTLPGKLAVISFSTDPMFCPGGTPQYFGASTNLAKALEFAKIADVAGIRFIVISDGEPDSAEAALNAASKFRGKIDVVYVGPESRPTGRDFLARLAAQSGGTSVTADRVMELAEKTLMLLGTRQ